MDAVIAVVSSVVDQVNDYFRTSMQKQFDVLDRKLPDKVIALIVVDSPDPSILYARLQPLLERIDSTTS